MKLTSILPIAGWLPKYKKEYFKGDLSAGLTVGIMLIPQGMAYALLAGMPPIYGLYAAIVPQIIYAIFGTSRQLAVGPVAIDSVLVAGSLGIFAQAESQEYIALAILLAMMVGVIQLSMGILRLGFMVHFLSHPVISGFTSAAALIIGFSQLKHLMGADLVRSQYLHEILISAFQHLYDVNLCSMLIGFAGILIILLINKSKKGIPAPFVVVVLGILAVWGLGLESFGTAIVKEVPKGLPDFNVPLMDWDSVFQLSGSAFTIALVAIMEAIAISKAIQVRHNDYKIIPNQELKAIGLANIGGSFFQSFPTTGGFSRSAVNDQSGAKTNLAAIISATFVILTLLFLTPLFYYLPKAILASIIMVAVFKLISIEDAKKLWKEDQRSDFIILTLTFIATLTTGIQNGILCGILLSALKMLINSFNPKYVNKENGFILGAIKNMYHSLKPEITCNETDLPLPSDVLLIQFKGRLYFANSPYFNESIEKIIDNAKGVNYIIFDGSFIFTTDSTGKKALDTFISYCKECNLKLAMVLMNKKTGLYNQNTIETALNTIKHNKTETKE